MIGAVVGIPGRFIAFSNLPLYGLEIIRLLFPPTVTNLLLINTGVSHILLFSLEYSLAISDIHLIFPFFKSRFISSLLLCTK